MADIRTERGLDRLVNFSDATVAIAITILVLPLVDLAAKFNENENFGEFFLAHYSAFVAFGITFVVIGQFWVIHHRAFEWVIDYSYFMVWINLLWLASIVFLPFAANALSNIEVRDGGVYALYISTMVVTSLSMGLIEAHLNAHPELLREDVRGQIDLVRPVVMTSLLLLCVVLAVTLPYIGLFWLFLLFFASQITSVVRRIRGRSGVTGVGR
ncbi:TMEM175 family protein [Glaciibacter flavus]|uniref:TMEM175 family protein n=1 Tax=Orlajensenia flava TaxID=2565934 RepID=UPI003AFFF86C